MLGDRLRIIREQRQLTQEELNEKCGLGANAIWKYENKKNDPTSEVITRIAKELDVSSDYLLGLVDAPQERLQSSDLTPDQRKLLAAFDDRDSLTLMRFAVKVAEEAQSETLQGVKVARP